MTEEAFLDEVTLAESGLMDDYVVGRLDDAERADFERHFLSTDERRRQLRFTQSLARYAAAHAHAMPDAGEVAETDAPQEPSPRPAPTFGEKLRAFWGGLSAASRAGLALACVAVIVGALWLARPAAPLPHLRNVFIPALTLAPTTGDRATGAETPKAKLPPGADTLNLALTLPEGNSRANSYRAELLTSMGRVEAVEVVGHDGRSVEVVVPRALLARGQYAVRLFAVGADKTERPLGSYLFNFE